MELYQLKTFVQVAEEGNLTRAASKLFTSQPAISAQIKALEDELNLPLFQRSTRGMQLTEQGKQLLQHAQQVLAAANNLQQQALGLQDQLLGEPRIGVHTDFEFVRGSQLFRVVEQHYPRLRLHFVQSMSTHILADLAKGSLDGGFFFGPNPDAGLNAIHLEQTPMRIVGPIAWKSKIEPAQPEQLAKMRWIFATDTCPFHAVYRALLGDDSGAAETARVDAEDAVRDLVRAGVGLAVMRDDDAQSAIDEGFACSWPGQVPSIALNFAVLQRRMHEPMIRALLETVRLVWPEASKDPSEAQNLAR